MSEKTIFDDQAKWTELYKNLLYTFCKHNGIIGNGIVQAAKKLKSNSSYEKIQLIKNAIDEKYDNDELKLHLFYLIGTMKALGLLEYQLDKKKFEDDGKTHIEIYKKLFSPGKKQKATLSFNRKKAAEDVRQSFDCLLAVCDVLIKADVGNIPINDITPDDLDPTTKEGARALRLLENLWGTNRDSVVTANEIDSAQKKLQFLDNRRRARKAKDENNDDERKKAQNAIQYLRLSKAEKEQANKFEKQQNWSNAQGIKTRPTLDVSLSDNDTPISMMTTMWRLYKLYNINLFDNTSSGFDDWISTTVAEHDIYKSKEDLLNLNFYVDVVPKINKGYFDVTMQFGFTEEQYRLLTTVIELYKNAGRLNTICFLPPIEEIYDFCSLFSELDVYPDDGKNRLVLKGEIYPEKATKNESEMLKDSRIINMLNVMDYMNNQAFGISYVEAVERGEKNWTKYLSIKQQNKTKIPVSLDSQKDDQKIDVKNNGVVNTAMADKLNAIKNDLEFSNDVTNDVINTADILNASTDTDDTFKFGELPW